MKKKFLLFTLAFITLFNCDPLTDVVDSFTQFDVDDETTYTIPAIPVTTDVPIDLTLPDIESAKDDVFEKNNTNKDLVESFKLKSMSLNIITPEGANFNFLSSVRLFIKTENLEEIEVANQLDIENLDTTVLELNVLDKELKNYLKDGVFSIRVSATFDETTSEEIVISIQSVFAADAKVLGV